jgi:hypothetical protein
MLVNPNNIPKKKFDKLLGLTATLRDRRLYNNQTTRHKSNHAAFILTKNLDIISYGENNCRNVPDSMSTHAEVQAIRNIKQDRLKYNKTYCLYVTKLSPSLGLLGDSLCCTRCNLMILQNEIKITKIYYSIDSGIAYCNVNNLPIHITERDKKSCSSCKVINKLDHIKLKKSSMV